MEECFTQTTHFLFFFLFFFYFFSSSLGCCWPHCCVSSASSYVVDAGIGWFWLFRFVLQPNKYIRCDSDARRRWRYINKKCSGNSLGFLNFFFSSLIFMLHFLNNRRKKMTAQTIFFSSDLLWDKYTRAVGCWSVL